MTATNSFGGTAASTVTVNYAAPSPRAYWKLNDSSGASAIDSSGNNYTGTITSATWTTGVLGTGALQFNGTSSKVTFGTGPSLAGTTDFTVTAWIKTTATASGVIIQQRDIAGFNGEYMFQLNANGTLKFMIYGNNAYQFDFNSTTTINNGAWHLVTAVRQGTVGTIYIDGVQRGTASGTVRSLSNTISVAIGADIRDNNDFFNGTIDEVRIYDVALSAGRIAQLANLAPVSVSAVVINDGAVQRSRVTTITVAFNGLVNLPTNPASAFSLVGPNGAVGLMVDATGSTATQTNVRITFTGADLQAGSLADGRYTFSVLGDNLTDGYGAKIDAESNGQPGGTRVTNLHRLFGDADGDADVDNTDFVAFRLTLGNGLSIFDSDGDGDTDNADFVAFRVRFGTTLP